MAYSAKKRASNTVPTSPGRATLYPDLNGKWRTKNEDGTDEPVGGNNTQTAAISPVATPNDLPANVAGAGLFYAQSTSDLYLLVGSQKFIVTLQPV